MRRLFTMQQALAEGRTESELRWGLRTGSVRRIIHGVYGDGGEPPSRLDAARALVLRCDRVAGGLLAGVLHGLDSVVVGASPTRRRDVPEDRIVIVGGLRCTDGLQTLVDLAALLDDDRWEQALESALRKGLLTIADLELALPDLARRRTPGVARIRRVLGRRPKGAKPTGSLLETLMVQLARTVPGLGEPERRVRVENRHGDFVAYVDLAWPDLGLFIELDGQQHKGQPQYDATRQTAVVAATGWLCGRFTWHEVRRLTRHTAGRLAGLADQAQRRPLAS